MSGRVPPEAPVCLAPHLRPVEKHLLGAVPPRTPCRPRMRDPLAKVAMIRIPLRGEGGKVGEEAAKTQIRIPPAPKIHPGGGVEESGGTPSKARSA